MASVVGPRLGREKPVLRAHGHFEMTCRVPKTGSAVRQKFVYLTFFGLHFLLILAASCRDTFSILAQGGNILPRSFDRLWGGAAAVASAALGEELAASNPMRQALAAYTHAAGIEGGYAYFAPNVPNSHKLVFEIYYPDQRVEYALPHVGGAATGLRLVSLFDNIAMARYGPLREIMLKMLAYSIWREHPEATTIRAVFGIVHLPSAEEFSRGKKESYEFLYAYDFHFRAPLPPAQTP